MFLTIGGPLCARELPSPSDEELLAHAATLLGEVPLIDGHNDLPYQIQELLDGDPHAIDLRVRQPDYPADIPRLREGRVGGQFWVSYVDVRFMNEGGALRRALNGIDIIYRILEAYPDLELALTADEIERTHGRGKIASMIGIEGGHAIESSLSALRMLYELGARYMTLTHWATTDWADAATDHPRHRGLTEFGEEVVREMNRLGMFVDLSHVSEETMLDALRVSRAPIIFSHSSARAVQPHVRNVPDNVLHLLRDNGGVIMVNFIADYVAPGRDEWQSRRDNKAEELQARYDDEAAISRLLSEWEQDNPGPRGSVADVANHIDHIRQVAGIDHVGIGSDFYDDGEKTMISGLESVSDFPALIAELLRRGYTDQEVKKIAGLNLLRAMRQMEQAARRIREKQEPVS